MAIRKDVFWNYREKMWFADSSEIGEACSIDSVGITCRDPSYHIVRLSGVDFYVFEYVLAGHGTLKIENQLFKPEPGDVWLMHPETAIEYWSDPADPWEKLWFNVSGVLVRSLVDAYQLRNSVLFRQCPLEEEFREAVAIIAEHRRGAGEAFVLQMHKIIALMSRHQRNMTFERGRKLAVLLRDHLHAHWKENPSLKQLGELIDRTPEQTLRLFKKEFGTTPMRYLAGLRLHFTRQYLLNTDYTLRTIAEETGFRDEYYFAAWFKHQTGIAPGRFRAVRPSGTANPRQAGE